MVTTRGGVPGMGSAGLPFVRRAECERAGVPDRGRDRLEWGVVGKRRSVARSMRRR